MHLLWSIWYWNSSLKLFRDPLKAMTAPSPSGQKVRPKMLLPMPARRSRSPGLPSPYSILLRTLVSQGVPSRQGVHLPHDSWLKNLFMMYDILTMQVELSITMTAPEPSIEPLAARESKSRAVSMSFGVSIGALTPPGMKAFRGLPSLSMPPQWLYIRSFALGPIGSPYKPGL